MVSFPYHGINVILPRFPGDCEEYWLFPTSFVASVGELKPTDAAMTLSSQMEGPHSLMQLRKEMPEVVYAVVVPGECLFIPSGWMAVYKTKDGVMVYGVRRNMFFAMEKSLQEFSCAIELQKASGGDVQNITAVKGAMEKAMPKAKGSGAE